MEWTSDERRLFRSLNSPFKIQDYLYRLTYNPEYTTSSPRWVMITEEAHCLEGCLFAAAALEFHGHKPVMINLESHDDDYHAITVYKTKTGWGSLSKSNTTLLAGRMPFYQNPRELVMSYFDFFFNTKSRYSLLGFTKPVDLNFYNHWEWRTSDADLNDMGLEISHRPHQKLLKLSELKKLPRVNPKVTQACFLGADESGLFKS